MTNKTIDELIDEIWVPDNPLYGTFADPYTLEQFEEFINKFNEIPENSFPVYIATTEQEAEYHKKLYPFDDVVVIPQQRKEGGYYV